VIPKRLVVRGDRKRHRNASGEELFAAARTDIAGVFSLAETRLEGLSSDEARERLAERGPNTLAVDRQSGFFIHLRHALVNPLVVLLAILAVVSFATGDPRAGAMMSAMITMGAGLKLFQEERADRAASKLKSMISVNATVLRDGRSAEIPVSQIVPGDIVTLAAGDMIPADVRIVIAKDLYVVQSPLTGESFPAEKVAIEKCPAAASVIDLTSIAFLGTSVASGAATAVVIATGKNTYLSGMAGGLGGDPPETSFDRGIGHVTWLMIRFVLVMVPVVFLINGLTKGNWSEAFFFAIAVAVGLTPEMLPMIVAVCLSKGALAMSRRKVIVKRLDGIQNLGAMDVLCTDKTGTLTCDRVILERHCDVALQDSEKVLGLAYMNSHFQTGLKNVLDRAVLAHVETHADARIPEYTKVDEVPFDFDRRIMTVVVRTPTGSDLVISKGAPEAIYPRCDSYSLGGELFPMDHPHIERLKTEHERLSAEGFRVLAIATREIVSRGEGGGIAAPYSKTDEQHLILEGYVAFLDPPKDTARAAIHALQGHGVVVKVVTGDNELVARKICREVGLPTDQVLLGEAIESMTEDQLVAAVDSTSLFARVSPSHKTRIIAAIKARGHTVGFMGDGINDAAALRAADVGISVDTAVDIAKDAADMILLEKSLLVLESGVVEGRKVFANILKYVRMGASSNFGNMFSVVGASLFIPYLPMTPIQILANNLLYDVSQTAIPTDEVDPEQVKRPSPWDIGQLTRYILFIGPCSSLFDATTFLMMLYVFNCRDIGDPQAAARSESLFQSGWFVESLLTQTLIIHVIRTNRIPFLQSRPSWPLLAMSAMIMTIGITLPASDLGAALGLSPLPWLYWPLLGLSLAGYVILTQVVKMWLLGKGWI